MFKNQEFLSFPEGLLITVFSMVLVFIALLLISFIIDIMRVSLSKKEEKKSNEKKATNVNTVPVVQSDDDGEIAAVLSAAVAAMEDEESEIVAAISAAVAMMLGKETGDFVVRNIKRMPELDTAWAKAGRTGLMR